MGALMAFRVGQEVVCVDDTCHPKYLPLGYVAAPTGLDGLRKGQTYTIREISSEWAGFPFLCLRLNEITRPVFNSSDGEPPYCAARFRPIVKTDISIFEAMLVPSPKQRVDA